jgi:TPR repeat protein
MELINDSMTRAFEKNTVEHNASTLFTLGERYRVADGVEQDYMRARLYYELAAGRGHTQAQYHLGITHDKGHGVE